MKTFHVFVFIMLVAVLISAMPVQVRAEHIAPLCLSQAVGQLVTLETMSSRFGCVAVKSAQNRSLL